MSEYEQQRLDNQFDLLFTKPPVWVAERQHSCDDRNTDNAWIESTVYNYHDSTGDLFDQVSFDPSQRTATWRGWVVIVHCCAFSLTRACCSGTPVPEAVCQPRGLLAGHCGVSWSGMVV